jgi:transposase-like protein
MDTHPKPNERREARQLRAEHGMSLKRIATRLGVSVSTVHSWTADIELTPEQRERNQRGPLGPQNPEHIARRVATWRHVNRERRRGYQSEGRAKASQRDELHLAGCMLYWAEGAKRRNVARLCNSDVHMLRFFRRFLTTSLGVKPEQFRLAVHVYLGNGLSIEAIENYWLRELDLPRSCVRKHQGNPLPTSSSGRKRNKLPYGVCTLSVNSTRVVQHIYGAIQEYARFEEPRWLD